MKKNFLMLAVFAMAITSCTTMNQTATQRSITCPVVTASTAELDVSDQKVTYTLNPSKEVRRGGVENCVNVAIQEALKPSGGDVLVETHEAIVTKRGLFGKKVNSVTVSGYPAKYKNFRPVNQKEAFEAFKVGVLKAESTRGGESKGIFGLFKK